MDSSRLPNGQRDGQKSHQVPNLEKEGKKKKKRNWLKSKETPLFKGLDLGSRFRIRNGAVDITFYFF